RAARHRPLQATQPDAGLADQGHVRRHLLPQRHDLFRRADQGAADRPFHRAAEARRLALYRPFGVADRRPPESEADGPHHLREDRLMVVATSTAKVAVAAKDEGIASAPGRRFHDAASGTWMVKVFPGEYYVTSKQDE